MHNLKMISAWIPPVAGLVLITLAAGEGRAAVLLAAVPSALIIAGGTRCLIYPDLRAPQQVAIGAVLAILLALPVALTVDAGLALAMLGLAIPAFIAGGWYQVRLQPRIEDVPAPRPGPVYSAKVALDSAMLGGMAFLTPPPTPAALAESVRDTEAIYALFSDRGYLATPQQFHTRPPDVTSPNLASMRIGGYDGEHLHFDSTFEPDPELPGRDRWLAHAPNRTAHAWILRHRHPAPWLVCVHGFGMGNLKQDFRIFKAGRLHERCGVNIAQFVLPVHGARSPGGFNGSKFFGLSPIDFIHAETQAMWDLRRLIAWIRQQDATGIGLFGISLGGYTSALLSALEQDIDCVVAAVPPSDMIAQLEYYAGTMERRQFAAAGVDWTRERAVTSVVAPLAMPTQVPVEGRYIFGATGDQFVPIEQVNALWRHWEQPRIRWATSGHVTALQQRGLFELVEEAVESRLKSREQPA